MPYRRLPNTDASRLRALITASEKGKELPPFKLAFSQISLHKLQSFLPNFQKILAESQQSYKKQTEKSHEYLSIQKKAKLYISHFIQVLNMAILRGDLPSTERKYYGISDENKSVPSLNSESEIIKWGEKIIHGESLRAMERRSPVTNPSIAVVKVRYETFLEAYKYQKILQKNHQRSLERLEELRNEANEIILIIWNEVENKFSEESEASKRHKAESYGVVYVFRKGESTKITLVSQEEI